jgi:hypothetical protein
VTPTLLGPLQRDNLSHCTTRITQQQLYIHLTLKRDVAGRYAVKGFGQLCTEWNYNTIRGSNIFHKSKQQTKILTPTSKNNREHSTFRLISETLCFLLFTMSYDGRSNFQYGTCLFQLTESVIAKFPKIYLMWFQYYQCISFPLMFECQSQFLWNLVRMYNTASRIITTKYLKNPSHLSVSVGVSLMFTRQWLGINVSAVTNIHATKMLHVLYAVHGVLRKTGD